MNVAENTEVIKWRDILDKLRKLNIIASAEWDTFPSGTYVTDVTTYQDVGLKSLHYETNDLQDMIEELEVYYLRAKNKNTARRFWDGLGSLWYWLMSIWIFLQMVSVFIGGIVIFSFLSDAGLMPEIMEALKELIP